MTGLYPEESQKMNLFEHLEEFRRRILLCLAFWGALALLFFSQNKLLLQLIRRPLGDAPATLIFIHPAEAFTASLALALLAAFLAAFPIFLYHAWRFLSPAIAASSRRRVLFWFLASCLLFFLGASFSYFIALPAALQYLIGFGRDIAAPSIALGRYIGFAALLILMGGVIFEIPLAVAFLADTGLVSTERLKRSRRFAFLGILIAAALITPTQDVVNMALFAVPMWLLYEGGILLAGILEARTGRVEQTVSREDDGEIFSRT